MIRMSPRASDFRVAFTRAIYEVEHGRFPGGSDGAVTALFAEHLREALAHIIRQAATIEEAREIAKNARMGEDFHVKKARGE